MSAVLAQLPLQALEVRGTLPGNTTWSNTAEPYIVDNLGGPLVVPAGVTLTVQSGVTVQSKYSNKSTLTVQGTLDATGAAFALQTSDSAAGGKQAVIVSGSGACTLTRCSVVAQHLTSTLNPETKLFSVRDSGQLALAGTALVTGGGGARPTYHAVWAAEAALVAVSASGGTRSTFSGFPRAIYCLSSAGLGVTDADFTGNADGTGLEFANAGADLALTGDSFTGFGTAVRVPEVRDLTLAGTTITQTQPSLTSIGLYTATLTGFAAGTTTISNQGIGIRAEHAHRDLDTSGISFAGNQHDVYVEGQYSLPEVTEDTALLPGSYTIDNSAGAVRISPGATLTLSPGVIVSNLSPDNPLFLVEGTLAATGAGFELKTQGWAGTGGIDAIGTGAVVLTACTVTASDTAVSEWGEAHALRLQGNAAATLSGCDFEATAAHGYATRYGVLVGDSGALLVQGSGGLRSAFEGFPCAIASTSISDVSVSASDFTGNATGLSYSSDANLLLDDVDLSAGTTGIELETVGVFWANGCTIRDCTQGTRLNSRTLGADLGGLEFSGNACDVFLPGGFALPGSMTLAPCVYQVDVSAGPITVPDGVTLALPVGCTVRNTGRPTEPYSLFVVEGVLQADGAAFELKTCCNDNGGQGTRVFDFRGGGAGTFTACTLTTSDTGCPSLSQLLHLQDAASLALAGCTLSSTTAAGQRTCYGIVAEGDAALTLTGGGRTLTTISGFPVGILRTGAGAFSASQTSIAQCGIGLSWGGTGPFSASQTTIGQCETGMLLAWDAAGLDSSGITFTGNTYDRYLPGNASIAGAVTLPPGTYAVDCSAGPVTIPAGATLTIPAGCTVRNTARSTEPYSLFVVEGVLQADSATFELKTYCYDNGGLGTRVFDLRGTGTGTFTDCTVTTSDVGGASLSQLFHLQDAAHLALTGCALSSTTVYGQATCYGIAAEGSAALTLAGGGRAQTTITGFPVGIYWAGAGAFSASQTTMADCGKAILFDWDRLGAIGVTGITFSGNSADCCLPGGQTLTADTTLPLAPYAIDTSAGPVIVPAGVSLTIPAGCELRNVASADPEWDTFLVYGDVVATGTAFTFTTRNSENPPEYGTRCFEIRGGGTARFTDCTFTVSDREYAEWGRLFHLADASQLSLTGCTVQSTLANGWKAAYGVYVQQAASLTLQDCFLTGFPVAVYSAAVPAGVEITGNQFLGNSTYAVQNAATATLDCRLNWWGHSSGPRHRTNPLGLGDPVSDGVLFYPFDQTTVLPVMELSNHGQGQAGNAFAHAGNTAGAVLSRFALDGPAGTDCAGVRSRLSQMVGIEAANLTNLRLCQDPNANGLYDPGTDPSVAAGTLDLTAGTISFSASFPATGEYLLVADLVGLQSGDSLTVHLFGSDLQAPVGFLVAGGVTPAAHYLDRLYVRDHVAGQVGDGLSAQAAQTEVPLLRCQLTAGYQVSRLVFTLNSIVGIEAGNLRNAELVVDANADGLAEPGETVLTGGIASIAGTTGTLTFNFGTAPLTTGQNLILQADFIGLARGDAFAIFLLASGVTPVGAGTSVSGATLPALHQVEPPLLVLDTAFQVTNHFTLGATVPAVPLLGVMFLPAGRQVQSLTFRLADVYGIAVADIRNAKLVRDLNRNGVIEAGETQTVGGPGFATVDPATGSGTISFAGSFTTQGDYILVADFLNLGLDDTLTISLPAADVGVAATAVVEGGVSPVRHAVYRPDLPEACEQHRWTLTYRSPGGLSVCGSYSHDGTKAILGYSSGAAYLFDPGTNTPLLMLHRHYDQVQYAGFAADDQTAITVTRDGAVYLWDVTTGELQRNLFSDLLVRYAVPSPDCSELFIVTEGKGLLLDLVTGRTLWEFVQGTTQFLAVDYSPDGSLIVVGAADKRAYLLDAQTGQIVRLFQGHSLPVTGVTFAANGTRLLTSSSDATATLWYANNPTSPICTVSLTNQQSLGAAVSRDGQRIAMVTTGPYLRLFNQEALELWAMPISGLHFTGALSNLVFDAAGARLLLTSNSTAAENAALAAQFSVAEHNFLGFLGPRGRLINNLDYRARISDDGARLFLMHPCGLDLLFREPGKAIVALPALASGEAFDITPDGAKLAFLAGSSLELWAADETRFTPIVSNNIGWNFDPISLSASGGLAIVGDAVWRAVTGELYSNSPNPDAGYRNAFSPDESLWGIAFYDDMTIKTMLTADPSGSLEYGVTLTNPYNPMKILYHPDGRRIGCVDPRRGVQFYILWDEDPGQLNQPVGLYDFAADPGAAPIADASLSADGTMLLIGRGNCARLYEMRTGRVLRYFYPLHSGQATCNVVSVGFAKHDNLAMVAWSDNYLEYYERSRLDELQISPVTRTLPVGESQAFTVEAVYDDGSRIDVSPHFLRPHGEDGILAPGARLYADPPAAVTIEENRVTVNPDATGAVVLTAVYSEGSYTRTAAATLTVGESPLVALDASPTAVTLTHGVVLPISYVAEFADGYRADVTAATSLTADQPAKVTIAGNNVTVRPTAGACEVEVTGSYSYRGVTRTAQTTIAAHGPQSRWERAAMTPGGDVNAMAFSPDGTRLATGGSSGAICLYRVGLTPTQYEIEQVIPAHERPIQSLFYLPNTGILSVGADGQIRTWDLADTSEPVSAFAHDAAITCAAYRDGLVAFGDNLGRVLLLDTATNALRWTQSVHTGGTTCVALDADTVFSGGQDSTAALLRRANGEVLQRYPGFAKPLVAVGYLDGTTYALSEDKRLVTWTKGTADDNLWEYFFPAAPTALNWSGGRLYVSTDPNSTWVYDANMLLLRWIEHPPERGRIGCLAVSPDGTYLLTGRSSTVAEKVDRRTGKKVQELSDLHGIQFWNAARGSYAGSLEHSYSLSDARVTEDGSLLFTQSSKRTCKYTLGMPFTGERFLETGYFVPFDFAGLETTDDGAGLLATRVADSIYIMDMAARLLDMSVHTTCSRFAISLDGTRLLTNSPGSLTRFWDIAVDFPTVTHENPVFSYDLEFANGGDSLGSMPDDSFVSIFNAAGLRYSGIHVAIATSEGGGSASPPLPEDLSVSRGSQRCALVVRQKLESQLGTTWYSYVQVYDLSDRLAPVRLFEKYLGSSENVKPRVVATLSDDGSLLFYGAERVSGGEADVSLGHLVDLNTGNLLYVFSPPSAGSASNQGLAAAQFTRNDSALMVAWKEGYAEVYERRGMLRIEVSPQARTVPPASFVDLTAVAVYADGSSRDVSERVALAADRPSLVTLAGNRVTVKSGTAAGQQIQITASYSELGSTRTAVSTITAGSPTFLSLSVDPARLSLAPGGSASLHFFAHFAGGTTTEVTTGLSLTADPADRLTIAGTTVQVPALAQAGMAVVTARYLTQGDERSVQAFVNIQPPLESTNPGDFDHDRDVDFNDLTFFVGHYGETTSSPSWNSSCDFDRDGDVDFNDITYFAGIYGTSYGARKAFEVSAKAVGEAGPLVRVWLEGPATAKVGDSFQVRVYVEDASATATGVRGGPLDIFFDPALTACVLPFDPYRILQAPFNEMITHGRLLDGRIDELGGVTIESGLGDGVPVLYAVLSFRALAAGTAEFAATSGESGLSLAPPVGQVGLDLESFGSALAVMIQAGDSPPDGTDADDAMLDGLNGELYLLRGETAVRTLTFGVRAGATAAFDPAEGDLPAGPVGADGEEAFFVTAGGELLAADVRGPAPRIEWRVAVSAPAGAPGPWALAWQPPSDLPADRQMALIPTDDTWLPAGPPLDPEENGTLALPQDGIGRTEARYLLVVERLRPFTVHLNAGWNVLGISLEPTAASQEDFLNDPRVVVAWRWDPVTGYQIATDLQAHAGYWVYAAEACDLELRGVRPAASAVRLAQGWNLVAPSVVAESATAFPGVSSCWAWDAQTGGCFAVNPAPAGGRPCQPGAAYWVYASEDGALIWDR